jgi:hypothetical protein
MADQDNALLCGKQGATAGRDWEFVGGCCLLEPFLLSIQHISKWNGVCSFFTLVVLPETLSMSYPDMVPLGEYPSFGNLAPIPRTLKEP